MDLSQLSTVLAEISSEFDQRVVGATSLVAIDQLKSDFVGKKGKVALLYRQLGQIEASLRPSAGELINAVRDRIEATVDDLYPKVRQAERATIIATDVNDPTAIPRRLYRSSGRIHPVSRTRIELEDIFVGMGFSVEEGPEAESEWYNFEALNIPKFHPARDGQDSFYLDLEGEDQVVLRTHTSPVQIRVMQSQTPPIYAVMPGRVYRRDTADARHTIGFHQIEGLVVDRGITFGHLASTIETFTKAYFGPDMNARLRPAYFPFTEPSAEFEVTCTICRGQGCRTCSNTGWIELGGCGMVHPNVLRAAGLDPETYSGFAFGFGIDRLTQMRDEIADMRILTENDLRYMKTI
ncbi:MAG: phenylalanine--tRNA ligase subunit alpha [Actinomycetota bacterium]|nr:phenylalanine--tRNA ligase subunit alpha [Actinomycetota bacterium]